MAHHFRTIQGRVESLTRLPIPARSGKPPFSLLAQAWAPVLLALTGNDGMAVSVQWQNIYIRHTYEQLDAYSSGSVGKASETDGKSPSSPFPVEIEVGGSKYRGVLGGLCFQEGDNVIAVVDDQGGLLAVSTTDKKYIVMHDECVYGLGELKHGVWYAFKLLYLFFLILPLLAIVGLFMFDSSFHIEDFLLILALVPIAMAVILGLALILANRDEFWPAWLALRIFEALERPDLSKLDFYDVQAEAKRTGKIRPMDSGWVFYC